MTSLAVSEPSRALPFEAKGPLRVGEEAYGKKERGSHLILKIDKDTFIFPCQFVFFLSLAFVLTKTQTNLLTYAML